MNTAETIAVDGETGHDDHLDDHHDHGEFIAHHFDSAEQQFDSGKQGIWVFLVTEVLFFSGLFCAYALYRYHRPDVFVDASQFLDKVLGGINTVVLLFSSLTMAWAVRAAMLGQNRLAGRLILVTMVCAGVFLGVKAVEYSHKWDLNIFVASKYHYVEGAAHPEPEGGVAGALHISQYLVNLSIVPTILLVGFASVGLLFRLNGHRRAAAMYAGLAIMMGGYFLGALGGELYQDAVDRGDHAAHLASDHAGGQGFEESADLQGIAVSPQDIGVFFSIYYCMTGLHAFHVIGGMIALSWLYYRCLRGDWRRDYFGPVDFVGLYWHLVDLIWIFLFPLLYLIK